MSYQYTQTIFCIEDTNLDISFSEKKHNENFVETKREDGTLLSKSAYRKNQLHGPSYTYYKNGQLASEAWFIRGLREGKAKKYSSQGTLLEEKGYKKNMLHGLFRKWKENNSLIFSAFFNKGKVHGTVELLGADALPIRSTSFSNGRRHGIDEAWTEDNFPIFCEKWGHGRLQKVILEDIFARSLQKPH